MSDETTEAASNHDYQEYMKPRYIDLFCGSGGFSLGFEAAGFKNLLALDFNKDACSTYRSNFPNHNLLQQDIRCLLAPDIKKISGKHPVDVIVGGPPCQGFSMAGNIGRKFIEDPRNLLFKEFARVVDQMRPKVFVIENVARLYIHNKGSTRNEIIKHFERLGYTVDCKVLCAADYGVPQIRNRIFFIGNRISTKNIFPEKTTSKHMTVAQALEKYPALQSGMRSEIPNHVAMNHGPQMLKKMGYVRDGGTRAEIPHNLRPTSGDSRKYIRYQSQKPAVCVTGDMRKIFHYNQNRALTVRELATLQSFPDSFVFLGNTISQQQQVGNAVPPLLAEAVAKSVAQMLKR